MPIHEALREHTCSADWQYRAAAELLYRFQDAMNGDEAFAGELPSIVFRFAKLRRDSGVRYSHETDGEAVDRVIWINTLYAGTVAGLLDEAGHKLGHAWQHAHGNRGCGAGHNRELQAKLLSVGLPCGGGIRCVTLGRGRVVEAIVRSLGVDLDSAALPPVRTQDGRPIRTWACECSTVRSEDDLAVRCERCNTLMRTAPRFAHAAEGLDFAVHTKSQANAAAPQ